MGQTGPFCHTPVLFQGEGNPHGHSVIPHICKATHGQNSLDERPRSDPYHQGSMRSHLLKSQMVNNVLTRVNL